MSFSGNSALETRFREMVPPEALSLHERLLDLDGKERQFLSTTRNAAFDVERCAPER
jgi:hypothetical protein